MNNKKRFCILISIVLIFLSKDGFTQTMQFVPPHILASKLGSSISFTHNYIASKMKRESMLQYIIDRDHRMTGSDLSVDQFTGKVSTRKVQEILTLQYGLFQSFNILASVAVGEMKRTSNVEAIDKQNTAAVALAKQYTSASKNGLDNLAIDLLYRPIYTDATDFHIALGYEYRGGEVITPTVALNDGVSQLRTLFHVTNYFYTYPVWLEHNFVFYVPLPSTEKDSQNESRKIHGGELVQLNTGAFYSYSRVFGGVRMQFENKSETKIDSKIYDKQAMVFSGKLVFGFGNMKDLEEDNNQVTLPWEAQVAYAFPIAGRNAANENKIDLHVTAYF